MGESQITDTKPGKIQSKYSVVDRVMEQYNWGEHGLIEVMLAAQNAYGHISRELLEYISTRLNIPLSKAYGVATFYDSIVLETPATIDCLVCTGPSCALAGAEDVIEKLQRHAGATVSDQRGQDEHLEIQRVSCLGLCDQAPAALVNEKPQVNINQGEIQALLRGEVQSPQLQIRGNVREITGKIGRLAPTDLDLHLQEGAFKALEKALHTMSPEQVIDEVKESRLSGRGGASFPTGLKWELARKSPGREKYVVCNFDESEPGTFKDRLLMKGDPFRVLEGLMLSAYAVNAHTGYIFIRGEYPDAQEVVEEAVNELYAEKLLGEHIMESDYNLDIELRRNAGAYICGEETALFEAIAGRRGHPRLKPPYPTQRGLFDKPTAINNVETLAVVPSLVLHGGEWFHQWGTANSVGLKLFCLSGHVNQPGVIEAPYGYSVRQLVEEFGGGFVGDPQAVLIGGAAGGFLQSNELDVPLTHEDLAPYDVPIGSGAVIVFNKTVDMWKVLEQLAHFFVHESCGQCAPCRIGTQQIYKVLQNINQGVGTALEVQNARKVGETIKASCVCGLGMTAANPFLSHLDHA